MAKVSDGYTIGSVVNCIQDVITCKRMLQLRVKPLTHVELINALRLALWYKFSPKFFSFVCQPKKTRMKYRFFPFIQYFDSLPSNSAKEPVYREEEEAFLSWYDFNSFWRLSDYLKLLLRWSKTPLGRLKARAVELENEARAEREISEAKKKAAAGKN